MKKTPKVTKAKLKPKNRNLAAHSKSKSIAKKKTNTSPRSHLPVHKRFILHPMTIMVVLLVGVLMIGITFKTVAQTIIATVEAQPLTSGSIITSPSDGSSFSSQAVTVTGSCPDNSYVNLSINNTFSGTAWCGVNNTWSIQTSLNIGQNTLLAQDYNISDVAGPSTPPINVTYNPPVVVPPVIVATVAPKIVNSQTSITVGSSDANTSTNTNLPILLSSNFHYQAFDTESEFTWTFNLSGGKPPYILTVNWGDGTSTTVKVPTDPLIVLHHKYAKPGYYPVIINTLDSRGAKKTLQLAALVKPVGATGAINFNNITPSSASKISHQSTISSFLSSVKSWLWLAWPTYLIVLLMVISYWLGEKNEYQLMFKKRHHHSAKR